MRRHRLRWFSAAIFCAVAVVAADAWAKIEHTADIILCPNIDQNGGLLPSKVQCHSDITTANNSSTHHLKGKCQVTNESGKNHTYNGLTFGFSGVLKSTYTVKANGTATVTMTFTGSF